MSKDFIIKKYKEIIDSELLKIYATGPSSLLNPINYMLNSPSAKRLRPLLTLISYEASCSKENFNIKNALNAALAIELFHNFTLVHDDIMDNDDFRHGKEAIHHKWGIDSGVLVGDLTFALALDELNKTLINKNLVMSRFIQSAISVCEGQALDKQYENINISYKEYIKMIDLKTANLFSLSSELGALCADINNDDVIKLKKYGKYLGRSFQIQDDFLEIFSSQHNMGKSLTSDLTLGKKTCVLVLCYELIPKSQIDEILNLVKNDFQSGLKEFRNIINKYKIKDLVNKEILKYLAKANNEIINSNIEFEGLLYFNNIVKNRGK